MTLTRIWRQIDALETNMALLDKSAMETNHGVLY